MQWRNLLPIVLGIPFTHALLRFPCSQLVTQRFDPLVNPGQVSPHIHQIVGGNAFNITMDPNNDLSQLATCTTCRFKEDLSNYWTAVLYFKHPNGSYMRVPQIPNLFTGAPNGGMTVYYIQPPNGEKTTAFQKGFRMIVGNPTLRNRTIDLKTPEGQALTFRCFSANFGDNDAAPGNGPNDTAELPKKKCEGGIRSNVYFPSCWDGKNLDSYDHASHVAYPTGVLGSWGLFLFNSTCPSSHPVRLPQLFMETVWDTTPFNGMWPTDGSQPFVWSMGDPTGYGQHADYVFGWKEDSLQRAMDKCDIISGHPDDCTVLTLVSDEDMNQCVQTPKVPEKTDGYLPALPGCNPIQAGPAQATSVPHCTAVSTTGAMPGPTAPPML